MKKIILSAAILAVAGLATIKANGTVKTPIAVTIQADSLQKTPVKLEELPDPVKTTLKADVFKEWVPAGAFLVKAPKSTYYEIDVKKGTDQKSVNIGADGKVVQ
jgi:hypothetical protein